MFPFRHSGRCSAPQSISSSTDSGATGDAARNTFAGINSRVLTGNDVIQEAMKVTLTGSDTMVVTLTHPVSAVLSQPHLYCEIKEVSSLRADFDETALKEFHFAEGCHHGDMETVWSGSGRSPSHYCRRRIDNVRLLPRTRYHNEQIELYNPSQRDSLFESQNFQPKTLALG